MTILDVLIPEAEIETLAPTQERILACLYEAHPQPVKVGDLLRAAGTGQATRRKSLNEDFLARFGLTIEARLAGVSENGAQVWEYSLQRIRPKVEESGQYVLTERYPSASETCEDCQRGTE